MFSWGRSRGWRSSSSSPTLFGVCLGGFLLGGALCRWFFGRSGRRRRVWVPRSVRRTFPATLICFGDSSPLRSVSSSFWTATFHRALAAASLPEFHFSRLRFDFGRFFDLELALQRLLHLLWNQALATGDVLPFAREIVSPLVASVRTSVWTSRSSTLAPSAGNRQNGQRRRPVGGGRTRRSHLPVRNVLLELLPLLSLLLPPV